MGDPNLDIVSHVSYYAMPGCVWHVAVFETLFDGLGRGATHVEHPLCGAAGDAVCRFEVRFGARTNRATRMPSG